MEVTVSQGFSSPFTPLSLSRTLPIHLRHSVPFQDVNLIVSNNLLERTTVLTLKAPNKNCSRRHFNFFTAEESHEISSLIFSEESAAVVIGAFRVKCDDSSLSVKSEYQRRKLLNLQTVLILMRWLIMNHLM